jgi:hypothetical protein
MQDPPVSEVIQILRAFASADISYDELRAALADYLTISGDPYDMRVDYHKPLEVKIELSPSQIRPVLERYWRWELSDEELTHWACLLGVLDVYTNPSGLDAAEDEDTMDPLWDLLSDLSAPAILGMSLRQRVEKGLDELETLQRKLSSRAV